MVSTPEVNLPFILHMRKIVPDMTYTVFSGTLSLYTTTAHGQR